MALDSRSLQAALRQFGGQLPHSILIVDDSPVVRRSLRSRLGTHSDWIICGEAGNGREAIEKSQQLHPDLIILDFSMPGMDGLTAARELNRTQPAVPLLMFTTFKNPGLEKEAIAAGCTAVISKSDVGLLFQSIEHLFQA
jgi:two-component system, chemotaxis family, protein-glutamate methylesterase/glutaminase